MQAPWYFGAETATLKHQRQQEEKIVKQDPLNIQFKRGVKEVSIDLVNRFSGEHIEGCELGWGKV